MKKHLLVFILLLLPLTASAVTSQTIDLTAPYTWTGLQQLNGNATTTGLTATFICIVGDTCRTTWPSTGSGVWPFTTTDTNYGVAVQSTTTPEWFKNGLMASSTSYFVYASSTQLSATSLCLTGDTCRTTWPTATTLTFATPLILNGTAVTWGGIATSSALSGGQVVYANNATNVASAGTSSIANGTGITVTNGASAFVIGSQPTINCNTANGTTFGCLSSADWNKFNNQLSTTSPWTTGQSVYVNANGNVSSVATGTVSAGSSAITVTANRSVLGGALSVDCAGSSASQNGCLSSTDWSTFNGKLNFSNLWNIATTFGTSTRATTTPAWFQTGLFASSSPSLPSRIDYLSMLNSTTTQATTTNLAILSLASSPLYVNANGSVISGGSGVSGNCVKWGANNLLADQGAACGSGGGGGDPFTHPVIGQSATTSQLIVGTSTTQLGTLTLGSSTVPQLMLSDNKAADSLWSFRNSAGNLYIATSTALATSSQAGPFTISSNGTVGIASSSPSFVGAPVLAVVGTTTFTGQVNHYGTVSCDSGGLYNYGLLGDEWCGLDNTDGGGVQRIVGNNSNGANAWTGFTLNNDIADNSLTHYAGLYFNSSKYTSTFFGTSVAVANEFQMINTDGPLRFFTGTSTLNTAGTLYPNLYMAWNTGSTNSTEERMRLTAYGDLLIGTTTGYIAQTIIASSTGPQLAFSDKTPADNNLFERWVSNSWYLGTSTATATSTPYGMWWDSSKAGGSLSVGSSTPTFAAQNGIITIGANSTGSSTVSMGRIQIDGLDGGGQRRCVTVSSAGSLVVGPAGTGCTHNQ